MIGPVRHVTNWIRRSIQPSREAQSHAGEPSANRSSDYPPFEDLMPTVEWQVAGHCNYDCTYCIQSKEMRVGAPTPEIVDAIVAGLQSLPGAWEIKISGGEPFAYKGFVTHVVPKLIETTPHTLSVLTNFSAPLSILGDFALKTGERLRIVSASLHPDTVSAEDFIAKAIAFRDIRQEHNPLSSFVVNVVLVPGKIENHFRYRDLLAEQGIRYFPQWMKIKGGVYPYSVRERSLIEQLTGGSTDPMQVNVAPSYRGLHCEAGVWYFVIDQYGEAYTCRTGKRFSAHALQQRQVGHRDRILVSSSDRGLPIIDSDKLHEERRESDGGYLGSFVRGDFRRWTQGGPCPYSICPCTVPANRGVVRLGKMHRKPTDEEVAQE